MKKFFLILAVSLLLLVPPVWAAAPVLATDQYNDNSCFINVDPFVDGETAYARATGLNTRKTYYFKYYDGASTLQCTSPGYTGVVSTCDSSGGCYLDPAFQEGTWTVELLEGTKVKDTDTFTVNALPEFPSALGFGAVSIFSGFIYILIRKKVVGNIGKD